MKEKSKRRSFLKFSMWFTFLSTLGVGGGIFFLLFAVVPIEQIYTDQGQSQAAIDDIMKYYVLGWVLFGFLMSYVYYRFILKKGRWLIASILVSSSILLCAAGMYYFLNTGSGLIQQSQGEIDEGEQFTFGPYPEKEDLEQLKEEGYDGIISLLSPTLPIEKPLLDKEKKLAKEVGITLHSLPMLPWVGNNRKALDEIKKMLKDDDKRYYVHCYLGRHRVDVVKQLINTELDSSYKLTFLQQTTFERGSLFYFDKEKILIGPYPTDEEWFTRIKRPEVKEVISLLNPNHQEWIDKEQQVTTEMDMLFTHMPIGSDPTLDDIKKVADYVTAAKHKTFVHGFMDQRVNEELEAYISWGKTLHEDDQTEFESEALRKIGAKMIIGFEPTTNDKVTLSNSGIEQFIDVTDESPIALYQLVQQIKADQQLTYLTVNNRETMNILEKMAVGLLYGSSDRGSEFKEMTLTGGSLIRHERNLVIGPVLSKEEYESFAAENGVAQLIFLYSASITSKEKLEEIKQLASQYHIPLLIMPMLDNYEKLLIPAINKENGLNYIMTDSELMQLVNDFIKEF